MTRKDFELIAKVIYTAPITERATLTNHFAAHLAYTNPSFDRARFIAACQGR